MGKAQIIEKDGRPEWVVVPYADYERMLARLEDLQDIEDADLARLELERGEDETIPGELVERLLAGGEQPMKIWREYRGLTQEALAQAAGVTKSYVSQMEAGKRPGSVSVLKRLAAVLAVDLDNLVLSK